MVQGPRPVDVGATGSATGGLHHHIGTNPHAVFPLPDLLVINDTARVFRVGKVNNLDVRVGGLVLEVQAIDAPDVTDLELGNLHYLVEFTSDVEGGPGVFHGHRTPDNRECVFLELFNAF